MVAVADRTSPAEAAALGAATGFKLENIKQSRRRGRYPRSMHNRQRINRNSIRDTPQGFYMCPSTSCKCLIPSEEFAASSVTCSAGHTTDLREWEEQEMLNPGGISHSGLTNVQQGRIAEQIVWNLHDLGTFGTLVEWLSDGDYNAPCDMLTSTGLVVEVRSVSTYACNKAFALNKGKKARMDAEMRRRKAPGQLGILVILDFISMTADIYIRFMERAIYFECPQEAFVTGVPFTNPYAEPELVGVGASVEDIPF